MKAYAIPIPMFTHTGLWSAIDNLAASIGTSTSGLAKRAGLDATSFNKSKRMGIDGKPRWPSTESIARVLASNNLTLSEFLLFLPIEEAQPAPSIPLITLKDAMRKNSFDLHGFPQTKKSVFIEFPDCDVKDIFALEMNDDSYAPLYRNGSTLIVSPSAPLRRFDRVAIKTGTQFFLAEFVRQSANKIDVISLLTQKAETWDQTDIISTARILWASQ